MSSLLAGGFFTEDQQVIIIRCVWVQSCVLQLFLWCGCEVWPAGEPTATRARPQVPLEPLSRRGTAAPQGSGATLSTSKFQFVYFYGNKNYKLGAPIS